MIGYAILRMHRVNRKPPPIHQFFSHFEISHAVTGSTYFNAVPILPLAASVDRSLEQEATGTGHASNVQQLAIEQGMSQD